MRVVLLGLITSITLATAICIYCFYVLTATLFSEFDYNFDLDTRSPSILPVSAILQWYDPYFNRTSRSVGRYAAFGPIIGISFPEDSDTTMMALTSSDSYKNSFQSTSSINSLWTRSFKHFVYKNRSGANDSNDDTHKTPEDKFEGNLIFVKNNGCDLALLDQSLLGLPDFDGTRFKNNNTIILNERGGCSFYDKILNFQKKGVKAIIVGNDQLKRGLLTMFSKNMPESVNVPSIFITKETMNELNKLINTSADKTLKLAIYTGQTPSPLLDALLTLVFSPPIALLVLYVIFRLRRTHKKNLEKAPKNVVKNLPVFVYNADYLIPINEFEKQKDFYLGTKGTKPLSNVGTDSSKTSSVRNTILRIFRFDQKSKDTSDDSTSSLTVDSPVPEVPSIHRHLSVEELNQYQINQCSICLNQFRKLKSKVILLPCDHYFHYKCCLNWLCNYRKVCPICKHDITKRIRKSNRKSTSSARSFARSAIRTILYPNATSSSPSVSASNHQMVDRGTSPGINDQSMLVGTSASLNYHSINNEHVSSNMRDSTPVYIIEDSVDDISSNDVVFESDISDEDNHHNMSYNSRQSFSNNSLLSDANNHNVNEDVLSFVPENGQLSGFLVDEEQSIENSSFY